MSAPTFISELKRRNVLRAAVLYMGAVWALAQGIAQLTPVIGVPEWTARWFLIATAIGFPFWVAFTWFYEFTPTGLKRESELASDDSTARSTGRKLDRWIIAVLAVAVVLLLTNTFVWRGGAGLQPGAAEMATASADIPARSVAVLPFVNMSGDPAKEYFSDGITEEIINALAQVPELKVAARTSAFAFKGKQVDLRKVGEVLGVAAVLEGSVQSAGDQVRITAQLIDTRSGYHLWSEQYDRELTSIFAIEDEISRAIVSKLQARLAGDARVLVPGATQVPKAHDAYLRGLGLLAARALREADAAFSHAVELDPGYAQAWGALAETKVLLPAYFLAPMDAALSQAEAAARQALAIDPDTASAWVALGMLGRVRWHWAASDRAFRQALALAPGDAEANNQYAQFLHAAGQFEAALHAVDRTMLLDPLAPIPGTTRIDILNALHRYDEAAAQVQATIAAHPDFALAQWMALQVAIYRQRYDEAEVYARKHATLTGEVGTARAQLVRGLADPAQRAAAIHLLASSDGAGWQPGPTGRARWLAQLGAYDQALAVLERFAARGEGYREEMVWEPAFDPLRDDPRFKAVLRKLGLPYVPLEAGAPSTRGDTASERE